MELNSDIPLPQAAPMVAIVANIKSDTAQNTADAEAELDSIETVRAIGVALNRAGCRATLMIADKTLPERLAGEKPDFVFNIAEGIHGRTREAQVPALLDMLHIPYTGSDATTLCIALDKALAKRFLATYRIKTPSYLLLHPGMRKIPPAIQFPVIVKPNAEGSSKGIPDMCIARTREELDALLERNAALYHEDMLVESFVKGREFTVGLIGNEADVTVFSPMEIVYVRTPSDGFKVYSYTVKQDYKQYIQYECPASLDAPVEKRMKADAKKIFLALNCQDFCRIDFRLSEDGRDVYFIEANPLPGLAPDYSDYPMLAGFCGVPYDELIARILRAAIGRTGASLRLAGVEA
ncbi:MAG: ATP-grasp domain-containing protein [Candidatus Pelethousia sp.]|nr:ATP-grasp domain-containing protein [Candidatus Pelethousia sp.]